jgi:hypothetical protein
MQAYFRRQRAESMCETQRALKTQPPTHSVTAPPPRRAQKRFTREQGCKLVHEAQMRELAIPGV